MEIPTEQEQVVVQEIKEVQVVERIQEQIVETMYPIEYGIVTNWDDTEIFFPATAGRPKMPGIMVSQKVS